MYLMSDLLGPLLGLSPYMGCGTASDAAKAQNAAAVAAWNISAHDYAALGVQSLYALAPPLPEPGIHWTRTGGKSWRVVIVR